jgi:hypothetical protein
MLGRSNRSTSNDSRAARAATGQRFLMIKAGGSDATGGSPQLVVVQHFDEELKRLVPTKWICRSLRDLTFCSD